MSNAAQSLASKRITALLDENSFVEIGAGVTARNTDFDLDKTKTPSDGVVTGYGLIGDRLVYVYSQDPEVLGGSMGEMHAKKIARIYDMAMKMGAPVIGLVDCAGLRLQEATDALNAFGELYLKQTLASGIVPQISAIFGNCGGGLAVSAALTDFTLMEGKKAKLFVNAPNALAGNRSEVCDTADSKFQSEQTGLVDLVGSEDEVIAAVRSLVDLLPSNNEDEAEAECTDDLNRVCEDAESFIGDTAVLAAKIADDEAFFETKPSYAKEMVTGLCRLGGQTVGIVANRSEVYGEDGELAEKFDTVLTADGCRKAAKFVRFCDAFSIPVLSLTNVTGFKAEVGEEKTIAQDAAVLTQAFAEADVPKVNVVIGKAYGSAYNVMNSKALGADLTFAWENAEIGTMKPDLAAGIMYEGADASVISEKAAEYAALQTSCQAAARRGYVDTIIAAEDTRKYAIGAFEMLYTKREDRPVKKHAAV